MNKNDFLFTYGSWEVLEGWEVQVIPEVPRSLAGRTNRGKRIKIMHGCPFDGTAIQAHLPKRVGWPCPVRSALKRTPVQDFNSFSIMFY